jgi:hypothetical protein
MKAMDKHAEAAKLLDVARAKWVKKKLEEEARKEATARLMAKQTQALEAGESIAPSATSKHASKADKRLEHEEKDNARKLAERKKENLLRSNADPTVTLSAKLRDRIVAVLEELRGGEEESGEAAEPGGKGELTATQEEQLSELVALGFEESDGRKALHSIAGKKGGGLEATLDWLCLHLDEDALPSAFDPKGKSVELVGAPTSAGTLVRKLAKSTGFPLAQCQKAFDAAGGIEQLAHVQLLQQLQDAALDPQAQPEDEDESGGSGKADALEAMEALKAVESSQGDGNEEERAEDMSNEWEALQAIFGEEACSESPIMGGAGRHWCIQLGDIEREVGFHCLTSLQPTLQFAHSYFLSTCSCSHPCRRGARSKEPWWKCYSRLPSIRSLATLRGNHLYCSSGAPRLSHSSCLVPRPILRGRWRFVWGSLWWRSCVCSCKPSLQTGRCSSVVPHACQVPRRMQ